MPRKKTTASDEIIKLESVDRQALLRIIFDMVNTEPPVGEQYEFLLRKILDEFY